LKGFQEEFMGGKLRSPSWLRVFVVVMVMLVSGVAGSSAQQRHGQFLYQDEVRVQMPRPGRVTMIGVRLADVTAEHVKSLKLEKLEGALVESINPNSPAAAAGMREKDVIIVFDGERVRSASHLTRLVHDTPAGRQVQLSVMRDGHRTDVRITPEAGSTWFDPRFGDTIDDMVQGVRDRVDSGRSRTRLGVGVQTLRDDLPAYFGVTSGVLVTSVGPETPAAKAGLKTGDVITAVDGKAVRSTRDLINVLPDGGSAQEVTLTVVREKKEMTLRASF
jgi:serine protease Do